MHPFPCPAAAAEEGARPARGSAACLAPPSAARTARAGRGWAPALRVSGGSAGQRRCWVPRTLSTPPHPPHVRAPAALDGAASGASASPVPRRPWPGAPARRGKEGGRERLRGAAGRWQQAARGSCAGGGRERGERRLSPSPGAAGNLLGSCGAPAFPAEGAPPPMRRGPRGSQPSRPRERLVAGRPDGTPARSGEARQGPGGWARQVGGGRRAGGAGSARGGGARGRAEGLLHTGGALGAAARGLSLCPGCGSAVGSAPLRGIPAPRVLAV